MLRIPRGMLSYVVGLARDQRRFVDTGMRLLVYEVATSGTWIGMHIILLDFILPCLSLV